MKPIASLASQIAAVEALRSRYSADARSDRSFALKMLTLEHLDAALATLRDLEATRKAQAEAWRS